MYHCFKCSKPIELPSGSKPGFRESCPHCKSDIHCCHACQFHDPKAYNECHEPSAERVLEKDRANRCEYFVLRMLTGKAGSQIAADPAAKARAQLEDLFRK
jgi:hypothetical protein